MLRCLCRLLFGGVGLRCLFGPVDPTDEGERKRWRERRRRFRSRVRSAVAELLTEEETGA